MIEGRAAHVLRRLEAGEISRWDEVARYSGDGVISTESALAALYDALSFSYVSWLTKCKADAEKAKETEVVDYFSRQLMHARTARNAISTREGTMTYRGFTINRHTGKVAYREEKPDLPRLPKEEVAVVSG
jgi:hypothetical protein